MAIKQLPSKFGECFKGLKTKLRSQVIKENEFSEKKEFNFKKIRNFLLASLTLFILIVLFLPSQPEIEFTEKKEIAKAKEEVVSQSDEASPQPNESKNRKSSSENLWGSPNRNGSSYNASGGSQINYNTSMLIAGGQKNAKSQLRQGLRLPLRILDKVTISQEPVPVLAEMILDSATESGLKLPSGTRLYGEASFQKDSERANIRFSQMSLPNGQIKKISAMALGKDGQVGVIGRTFSDGAKNSVGQFLTTFVGGLASGSMDLDVLGRSKGGIENGLLNALAQTAKTKAETYGQKLKAEREWLEIPSGTECDALLRVSLNLQDWNSEHE